MAPLTSQVKKLRGTLNFQQTSFTQVRKVAVLAAALVAAAAAAVTAAALAAAPAPAPAPAPADHSE